MANRYVPFGYEIIDAKTVIVEREAEVIRNVFSLYVQGNSLKTITERLNMLSISYAGDGRELNKNMVKRIIENKRYSGEKGYPMIIPIETIELALKCKDKRSTEVNPENKNKLDVYRQKNYCAICGAKMKRKNAYSGRYRKVYWQCEDRQCVGGQHMFIEKTLDDIITEFLNEISDDLTLVEYKEKRDYEKDAEVIRMTNEMHELMQSPNADAGDVIDRIMDLAIKKFELCTVGDNTELTKKIQTELAIFPQKENVDGKMVGKIVKSIRMHPDKRVWVQLINGKEFERSEMIT